MHVPQSIQVYTLASVQPEAGTTMKVVVTGGSRGWWASGCTNAVLGPHSTLLALHAQALVERPGA